MTREDAKKIIYEVINSGIISEELEQELTDVANFICSDGFEKCKTTSPYCEDCEHKNVDLSGNA